MKIKHVKILWGRSGNRCAFPGCKIELTSDGEESTLGEMAHIVADSPNGPRGESDLTPEQRDEYSNLILLCPTHHTLIDSNPEEWSVEKLKQIKAEHENWVSRQLEQERIIINAIDNSAFIESRENAWLEFGKNYVWLIVSITPLNISEDSIEPLNQSFWESINSLSVPDYSSNILTPVNRYNTRPNEYGLVNKDFRKDGIGYEIQVFRNGHCEFMIYLEDVVQAHTKHGRNYNLLPASSARVLTYEDIARNFINQIQGLKNIWNRELPFNDMLMTSVITNTINISLYSGRQTRSGSYEFGSLVTLPMLKYSKVINKNESPFSIAESFIKRFVNYFGLNINTVFAENGNLNLPRNLYY
jgi:hypothetical protein